MIIGKTPFRVSFFGGGTDFPEFFKKHGGAVLGSAINKSIYHTVMRFPSKFFDYSIRLAYRQVECVHSADDIQHVPFRAILKHLGIQRDVEINLMADLPSFSGVGASSSFTVGLVNALSHYQGRALSTDDLARTAIHLEREVLKETVGLQDQIFAAYGGFNLIEFSGQDNFKVTPVRLSTARLRELNGSLMLFYTKISRRAQEVEKDKIKNLADIQDHLLSMRRLVDKACAVLTGRGPLSAFGQLLHETWQSKRALSAQVSNPEIDRLYEKGLKAGALGGKLLGAGGGGFMLFFVPDENQERVREALHSYIETPFALNAPGSTVIYNQ